MLSRRAILVLALLMIPLLSLGCGGTVTTENISDVTVTPEMMAKMHEEEAKRQEKYRAMAKEKGVELRGCPRTLAIVPSAVPAQPSDFGREFLDKILAVKVVDDLDQALLHVAKYGSNHTEAICTESYDRAQRWLREVDASCVLVNASTRFNDGGELGLGAEIGISTSKLHAFGPMGAANLTSKKWIVYGGGQVRG